MRTRKKRAQGERGIALLYAVFGAFVAAALVVVVYTMSDMVQRRTSVRRGRVEGRYLAHGALEEAQKNLLEAVANWQTPSPTGNSDVAGVDVPWSIDTTGGSAMREDSAGIQTLITGYELTASADPHRVRTLARRLVNVEATPVFQFAVFYQDDLEIQPGPNMNLGGRVHTNGDMYLGCGNTLTMDTNYVRAIGKMYRRRKDSTQSNGTVQIRKWVENPFDPAQPTEFVGMASKGQLDAQGISSSSGYDSDFEIGYDGNGDGDLEDPEDLKPFAAGALDFWSQPVDYVEGEGYTVLTGEHDLGESITPDIGSIAAYEENAAGTYALDPISGEFSEVGAGLGTHAKGFFHENAGLSILVNDNGTDWQAFDASGLDVRSALEAAGVVTLAGMPDLRQSDGAADDVPVVQIDMLALNASGVFPPNGLLFAAHAGMGEGLDAKGVVLTNGAELADDLTVVSEGSVYVHGDFNTTNKKGASVICDGVNLLSNAWDGSKTPGSLPDAADTTFQCAFITGNYATEGSVYNGGLENLPRFHERWSGVDCNIVGSMVCPWESMHATALWQYGGDRYTAPNRNWIYDTAFNDVANLPPFTPMAVTAREVVSW